MWDESFMVSHLIMGTTHNGVLIRMKMDWWPSPESNSPFIFILYWLEILFKNFSVSPATATGASQVWFSTCPPLPKLSVFPSVLRHLHKPNLAASTSGIAPASQMLGENQSSAAGTNNQSRTNLYFYITHSAKSEKNPADLLHPSPPSNPHCSPTNITAWPFSSGCSGAALAGALWRQKVMSESS